MSTYTPSLGLEEITPGDQAGLWGNTTNNNLELIDQAVTGVTPITQFTGVSGTVKTLDDANGALNEARAAVLNITGIATGPNTVVVPNKQKTYLVRNNTGQNVVFRTASPVATYTVEAGNSILIFCDGNNGVFTGIASPSVGTLGVAGGGTGATTFTAGFVKSTGGTNALTSSTAVDLASEVTGTLPVPRGGTGQTAFTSGGLLRGNGSGAVATLVGSANGQVATWNGSEWTAATPTTGTVASVFGRTGNVTALSSDYSSFYYPLSSNPNGYVTSASSPSFSGTVTATGFNFTSSTRWTFDGADVRLIVNGTNSALFNTAGLAINAVTCPAPTFDSQRITTTFSSFTSGLHPTGLQIGSGGTGIVRNTANGRFEILVTGYGVSAYFQTDGNNLQGNNSPSWASISDQNIKTNLRPINNVLDKINALKPCHFEYKNKLGETRTGFIAQEFAEVFPGHTIEADADEQYKEFLPEGVNTIKAIDLNLTPYLVKAIQELKAELDEAKAEIAALKAK